MTMQELMDRFLSDHRRYAEPALYSSFRKYATKRDELIAEYARLTGVPKDEFHSAIAQENARQLYG
jgi:23S rRNA G2445 N2-methylase RlmL